MRNLNRFIAGSVVVGLGFAGIATAQQQPYQQQPNQPQQNQPRPIQVQENQNQLQQNRVTNQTMQPGRVTFVSSTTYTPVRLPSWPAGFTAKDLKEGEGIRDTIASTTEAALTENGFDDLVERLVDQDRNRIGEGGFAKREFEQLNGRVAQLRKAFRDKYGTDFEISNENVVLNDRYTLIQGEVADSAAIAANWPVQATRGMGSTSDMPRSTRLDQPEARPAAGRDITIGEDRIERMNLEKGRNVAIMGFPGYGNVPELHVSLIHEMPDSWRIDLPNNMAGQRLHDSLLNNLTFVGDNVSQWPANADDARRMISHYVIAALYDVKPQQMTPQGQTPTP